MKFESVLYKKRGGPTVSRRAGLAAAGEKLLLEQKFVRRAAE